MTRKEFYESLSEDLKARIRACSSEEEMMQVLKENMIELDPDLLEDVGGGCVKRRPFKPCSSRAKCTPNC